MTPFLAFHFPVLGDKTDSAAHGVTRGLVVDLFPFDQDLACGARHISENGLHDLSTSGSHQARYAQDFTGPHAEIHVLENAGAVQVLYLKDHITHLYITLRITFADLTADHHLDDFSHIGLGNQACPDVLAVTEDGNSVAEFEDFFHSVGDINDGNAFLLKGADDLEKDLCLALCQSCRGLIHDDDPSSCPVRS